MSGARGRRAPTRDVVGTPALDTWRRELAAGLRTRTTCDALWRAACAEKNALEAAAAGLSATAVEYRREAAQLVRSAAQDVER